MSTLLDGFDATLLVPLPVVVPLLAWIRTTCSRGTANIPNG